jgi:hypothetical protein
MSSGLRTVRRNDGPVYQPWMRPGTPGDLTSLVRRDAAEAFRSHPEFLLVAAVRGEEALSATHVGLLEHGDCLVIMASGQANTGIMQTHREMTEPDR